MKQYRVAILGASGAVGQEMMKILAERKFPVGELHLLASARSAGKVVSWQGSGSNVVLDVPATTPVWYAQRMAGLCWQLNSTNSVLLYRSSEVCLLKPQLSSLRL